MTKIYKLLKQDHDNHREILKKIADTSGDTEERRTLFQQFKNEVTAHANAEEQALYSEMLDHPALQGEGRHSVAEHKEIDDFLEELTEMEFSNPHWLQKFADMRHRYEHHIEEEEEEIFKSAKDMLAAQNEDTLGEKFTKAKERELEQLEHAT